MNEGNEGITRKDMTKVVAAWYSMASFIFPQQVALRPSNKLLILFLTSKSPLVKT